MPTRPEHATGHRLPQLLPLLSDVRSTVGASAASTGREGDDRLVRAVEGLPEVLAAKPNHVQATQLIFLAAAFALRGTNGGRGAATARRCLRWLQTYGGFAYTPEVRNELIPAFLAMACLAVAATHAEPDGQATVAQVKDMLQRFAIDMSDPGLACRLR